MRGASIRAVRLVTICPPMSDATTPSTERARWRDAAVVAFLALLVAVNVLGNEIVYDDRVLVENPALREPWAWRGVWASTWWGEARPGTGLYRPLASWSLALNGWGNTVLGLPFESVVAFHAVNALLHAVASVLVLAFLGVLGFSSAAARIGAALFAVLAIHVEALAPITGRSETLALLFGLVFVLLHARRKSAVLAALAFLAALSCKESAVGFLGLACAMDVLVKRERPPILRHGLALAALGVFLVARWAALRGPLGAVSVLDNPLVAASGSERMFTALAIQFEYLWLMLVPVGFKSDASLAQLEIDGSVFEVRVLGCLAVLGVVVAWALRSPVQRRAIVLSIAGYAMLFAVTSNLLFLIGTARAERLAYAPSMFVCGLLGLACASIGPRLGTGIAVVLVAGNLVASLSRNAVWRDPGTFFRAQVVEAPRSAKARFNFGAQLASEGDDAGAEREYGYALQVHPDYVEALHNLGNVLRRRGEAEKALGHYRRALELQPQFLPAAFGIVGALHELGRPDEARAMLDQIERRAPGHAWLGAHRALLARPR